MQYFGEDDYLKKMETIVAPFLRLNLQQDFFDGHDNSVITYSYLKNPIEQAAIVISHGFCEFIYKYHEIMYYMYQAGFSVFFIDHRGHGSSQRALDDMSKVHVNSFEEYVKDMKVFVDEIVLPISSSKKLYLFAHSMGGAIGARFMEEYPEVFDKAILSSPMIEMSYGKMSTWQVKLIVKFAELLKWNERYFSGQHGFDNVYAYETSSSQSEARYKYFFNARLENEDYRTYGGTYAWLGAGVRVTSDIMKNTSRIRTPILLFQAGLDTLVQPKAQIDFAKATADAELVLFKDSKHEIFNAFDNTRFEYFDKVFEFLEK